MLIKDPYLQSHRKEVDLRSQPVANHQNTSVNSQPLTGEMPRMRAFSGGEVNELQGQVRNYQQ